METPDQRWARFPNDQDEPYGSRYYTPPDSREELLTKQALDANRTERNWLEMTNRFYDDPRPGRDLAFMDYRSRGAIGVTDVLGSARLYPDAARDYSGSPAGFTGSLRYSMGGW